MLTDLQSVIKGMFWYTLHVIRVQLFSVPSPWCTAEYSICCFSKGSKEKQWFNPESISFIPRSNIKLSPPPLIMPFTEVRNNLFSERLIFVTSKIQAVWCKSSNVKSNFLILSSVLNYVSSYRWPLLSPDILANGRPGLRMGNAELTSFCGSAQLQWTFFCVLVTCSIKKRLIKCIFDHKRKV